MTETIELPQTCPARLIAPLSALARVARDLAQEIARGALAGDHAASVGANTDGDQQKALDVLADEAFAAALKGTGVRWYASEERDQVVALGQGGLALAIDPLDGSSNIDANVSIGTIFSIYDALPEADASFLRPAREQIAAGYVIYGPQVMLVMSWGEGVVQFLLDPLSRRFERLSDEPRLKPQASEFAINMSNMRHWEPPVRAYVEGCLAGETVAFGRNYNMRWIASLVAETHRILARGGVFLYPADQRAGYARGRLRMVYECAPIAFLIVQAGGAASDGLRPILDLAAGSLHERVPFVFGCAENVTQIQELHKGAEHL